MEIEKHLIGKGESLREAFRKLNELSGGNMTLFVVGGAGELVGSLTDGDLRRAVISDASLDATLIEACHHDCMSIREDEERYAPVAEARKRGIKLLPILDANGRVTGLLDLHTLRTALPLDAVLMAGGKGERLRPLTLTTPKPLLEVGGKAVIDYNIEELNRNGIENIFVTVNYLKEQIIDHFKEPRFEGKVKCVEEPCRLGTMGSLAYVDGLKEDNLIVMNSDLLTSIDFEKMYLQHIESGAAFTMGVIPYIVSIPFAIINTEGRNIKGLTEKPTYNHFANAGVYMMRRDMVKKIEKGKYLDAPDFVETLIAEGEKVEYFPIEGTWIDIGSPDDFRYAGELLKVKKMEEDGRI